MPTHRSFLPERLSCAASLRSMPNVYTSLFRPPHITVIRLFEPLFSVPCSALSMSLPTAAGVFDSQALTQGQADSMDTGTPLPILVHLTQPTDVSQCLSCLSVSRIISNRQSPLGTHQYQIMTFSHPGVGSNCGQVHWDVQSSCCQVQCIHMMDRELLLPIAATCTESFIYCRAAAAEAVLHHSGTREGAIPNLKSQTQLATAAYCCKSSPKLAASISL